MQFGARSLFAWEQDAVPGIAVTHDRNGSAIAYTSFYKVFGKAGTWPHRVVAARNEQNICRSCFDRDFSLRG